MVSGTHDSLTNAVHGETGEQQLINATSSHLAQLLGEPPHVHLLSDAPDRGHDALLDCTYRGQRQRYAVIARTTPPTRPWLRSLSQADRQQPTLAPHASDPPVLPLLATPVVTDAIADALREREIQYIDLQGNAHLRFGSVLIDVRGRRAPAGHPRARATNAKSPTSLTSPRRAQIIMCLLAWPHLAQQRLQDLATASGTSPSQVHQTLNLLQDAGYMVGKEMLRHRRTELLDLWASAYATQLGPTLALGDFTSQNPGEWPKLPEGTIAYRSGEGATGTHLRASTATIYVRHLDPDLIRLNRWVRSERPNVFLRHQFWSDPVVGFRPDGAHDAPWPIVYADLLASNDPRHREAAHHWKSDNGH